MSLKALRMLTFAGMLAVAAACGKASPAQPSSTTGGSAGTSYAGGQVVTPADKSQITYASQPIVLAIQNVTASSGQTVTYGVEIATDSGFANKVYTKSNVAAESGSVTHISVDVTLPGSTTYYWHSKSSSGTSGGPFSPTMSFVVGPPIVLGVPVPLSPAQNSSAGGSTLTVANVTRQGPWTAITYHFDLADSSSFGHIVFSGNAPEQGGPGGQTTISITTQLTGGASYFWRVQAIDASGATSSFSPVFAFTAQTFDPRTAIMVAAPPDLMSWDVTAHVTSVDFSPDAFPLDFDRRDGPNRWPDLDFGDGGGGTLQYTEGMCLNIGGQWYCSACLQMWYGRELTASTPPSYVGQNWFYDSRWGPMQGHQPVDGEIVGLFVGTGNLRGKAFTGAQCPQICERSDVAFVSWLNDGDRLYTFSLGGLSRILKR